MAQPTPQRVKLDIEERRYEKGVRWKARDREVVVANVRVARVNGRCDTWRLTEAIAEHFHVDEDAVEYRAGPKPNPARFALGQAWVTLPPTTPEPPTCEHLVGDDACELATCDGTPAVTTVLDRDVEPISAEPSAGEVGTLTSGRDVINRVARETGLPVVDGFVGSTAWSERPGVRRIDGWWFTVGEFAVRWLAYESRESKMTSQAGYTAIFVDHDCVMRQRYPRLGEIVGAISEAVVARHDGRVMSRPPQTGWWQLKNPPVGFTVEHPEHGLVEVHEESTNDGGTLRVVDAAGTYRFVDRRRDEFWTAAYGGAAIGGHDGWERYQRRVAYSATVIAYRHRAHQHGGPPEQCPLCPGEVAGPRAGTTRHWWGRYVVLPFCPQCGLPRDEWENSDEVGRCPGPPRYPDAGPDGAPTTTSTTAALPVPADAQEGPPPVGRFHVRAGYPVLVDLGSGREGMANPCWCGRINLPEGDRSAHVYGLTPDRVTCPVCFHFLTCPWAQLKASEDRAALCAVCAHIESCVNPACNPNDHPGIVPPPDPTFDDTASAAALVDRIHQAVRDGDVDLAEKLVRAGENYKPDHTITDHLDGWDGLSLSVWRLRRHPQQAADAPVPPGAAQDEATVDTPGAAQDDAIAGWSRLFVELGI